MTIGEMFVKLGLDITDFSKGLEEAKGKLDGIEKSLMNFGAAMSALTLPLAGAAIAGMESFKEFETELLKIQAYANTTTEEFAKLRAEAIKLGQDTQFSSADAAGAMAKFAQSGFAVKDIYDAIPGVLNLAAAGQLNVANAAQIATDVLHGFGLAGSESQRVADVLAKTATSSSTSVKSLGSSFLYAASVSSNLNISLEEVAAALATLGDAGVRGFKGGTAIRAMFQGLLDGSVEAKKLLDSLGFSMLNAEGKTKSLTQVLHDLNKAGIGVRDEAGIGMARAFTIWGARANDVVKLIGEADNGFLKNVETMKKVSGAAESMSKTLQSGWAGTLERFSSSIETIGIALGTLLAPTAKALVEFFKNIADHVATFIEGLNKLPQGMKDVVIGFGILVVAIGPALISLSLLVTAVNQLRLLPEILNLVGTGFTAFGKYLISGTAVVKTALESLTLANFKSVVASIADGVRGMGEALVAGMRDIPGKIGAIKNLIVEGFSAIGPALTNIGSQLSGFAKAGITAVIDQFAAMQAAIASKGLLGAIGALASSLGTSLAGAISSAASALSSFGISTLAAAAPIAAIVAAAVALAAVAYTIYKNWDEVKSVLVGIWKDLQVAFNLFGNWLLAKIDQVFGSEVAGFVKKTWEGLVSFLGKAWDGIVNIVSNGLKYILEAARAAASAIGADNTASALQAWITKLDGMGDASKKMAVDVANSMKASADAAMHLGGEVEKAAGSTRNLGGAATLTKEQLKALADAKKLAAKNAAELHDQTLKLDLLFRSMPNSVQDFVDKFTKFNEVAPEVTKAQAYVEELRVKLIKLNDAAQQAFEKNNIVLAQGYQKLAATLDTEVKRMEKYVEQMKTLFQMDIDFSKIIKGVDQAAQQLSVIGNEAIKLPPIFGQLQQMDWENWLKAPMNDATNLAASFKALGISSTEGFKTAAEKASYYFDVIKKGYAEGKVNLNDMKNAEIAYLDAQIKYAASAGESVDALRKKQGQLKAELEAAGYALKNHGAVVRDFWQQLDKQVSTIFTDFGKGIADAMFSAKSLGDFFGKVFTEMGKTIVRFTVEYWTKVWLTELYKGIKGMTDFGVAASKSLNILTGVNAGGILDAAGNPLPGGGTGTGGTGTTLPGKDSLGGLTKAAGGLLGAVGAIASAIDAVFGALQYFQGRRIEQDVGRIEVTSRGMLNVLLQIQEVVGQYLPALQDLRFLQNFNLQMGQVADIITINFDKLIAALADGIKVTGNTSGGGSGSGNGSGSSSGSGESSVDPVTGLPRIGSNDPNILKQQIKELQDLLIKQAQSAANAAAVNTGIIQDAASSVSSASSDLSSSISAGTATISASVSQLSGTTVDFVNAATVVTAEAINKAGSYFDAAVEAIRAGNFIDLTTLDKSRLTQEQLASLIAQSNKLLTDNMSTVQWATTTSGEAVKVMYKSFAATGDQVSGAVGQNTAATDVNSQGMGLLGNSLTSNTGVVDANTRAGIMTSDMLVDSSLALGKTMEVAAKTYANATGIAAPDFTSAYKDQASVQAQIDALAKMLGADKGKSPIYTDPLWQKYLDLIGAYNGGKNSGGTPGGIGKAPSGGVTTSSQSLFNSWPSYEQLFPSSAAQNFSAAADAAGAFTSASTALTGALTTSGSNKLANQEPTTKNDITNNFYGVTDPAKMANQIVKQLSLKGVLF